MKKLTFLLLTLFVFSAILTSCNKDNETHVLEKSGKLTLDNTTYELQSGAIEVAHWKASGTDRTTFSFILCDKNISDVTYENMENHLGEINGITYVSFDIDKDYDDFEYRNNELNSVSSSGSHVGSVMVNFNAETLEADKFLTVTSCEFSIQKQDGRFIITFSGNTDQNKAFSGNYTGALHEFETYE